MAAGPEVLAVDDDEVMRILIAKVFAVAGITVEVCPDGDAMWGALGRHTPKVVLLDIGMPGDDGLSLVEQLRDRYGAAMGILMLSASGEQVDKAMAFDAGADEYVTKPCDWQALTSTVIRMMVAH